MLQFFKFFEIALLQDFNDSEKNPLIPIHVLNNGSLKTVDESCETLLFSL